VSAPAPLVSIVIPNRDQGRFLAVAIDSTLADPYPNVEVIVVDDGSTDESATVLRHYGGRVTSLATEGGRGACRARNIGLAAATGDFVKFLDADDFLLPGGLETQVRWLQMHSTEDASVYGDARWVDESGSAITQPPAPTPSLTDAERMILHAPLTSAPLHHVAAVRRVGGFDERVPRGQEYDLHMRMWLAGITFHHLPGDVYAYRQHGQGRISDRDAEAVVARGRLDAFLRVIDLAHTRFGAPLPDDVRRAFAVQLWRLGRRCAQQGATEEASAAFVASRSLDTAVIEGSTVYQAASRALGPIAAERMIELAKGIKRRFRPQRRVDA
jgi:glycosyltransferase involved in cell wall biosynthesis